MAIESLVEMKEQPGFVVTGEKNVSAKEVFDEICKKLSDFYEHRRLYGHNMPHGLPYEGPDLAFQLCEFRIEQRKYYCHVVTKSSSKKYATIKIERFDEIKGKEFVDGWDFPHAPFEWTKQKFGIYFNLVNGDKAEAERKDSLIMLGQG